MKQGEQGIEKGGKKIKENFKRQNRWRPKNTQQNPKTIKKYRIIFLYKKRYYKILGDKYMGVGF